MSTRKVSLTEEQINGILTEVPYPPGIGVTALNIARRHLLERLKTVLETIKLRPIQAAYEEFKESLIESLYLSYIEPGTNVGITAGVSLGGPVTQLSLNSFHFAGAQSGVALAFQKVRDFLTGSKMNRTPQMRIYFKVPYMGGDLHDTLHVGSFDSIMNSRHEFEQTMVSDVILDTPRILTREEAEMIGVPQLIALHSRVRQQRFEGSAIKFPLTHVVELQLNTYRMYTHKITMAMVARAIEGPAEPADSLTCVYRSQIDGKMYILVDETRDYGQHAMSQDMAILMFLHKYVNHKYKQWKINGITGIISIEPQEINVMKAIYRVQVSRNTPGTHYIYTNNRKTRWDGSSLADIHRLITAAGFAVRPISEKNKEDLYLVVDNFIGDFEKELNSRLKSAQDKKLEERTESDRALISAATFHYALTNGTNMEEIVWRDDIDLFRTASNHSHEILEMLGIDAARIFLIFRFMQTLQDFSSYINPRHVSLTFDLLCNLGIINSLSFVGVNRRRVGPLAMASYQQPMDIFVNSSIFGDKETVTWGVSSSLFVGQGSGRVGTKAIGIEEDLTVIPKDIPSLPSMDEGGPLDDFAVIDEDVFEGTKIADIVASEDIRQDRMLSIISAPVVKPRPATIISQPLPFQESIIPSGATVMMASQTLVNALQKVTTGTDLIVEPRKVPQYNNPSDVISDIGETFSDLVSLEHNTGLSIPLPQRARPQPPSSTTGILSSLQSIPVSGITISLPTTAPIADRIVPLSPTSTVPLSPTFKPTGISISLPSTLMSPSPSLPLPMVNVPHLPSALMPPSLPPPPIVNAPPPPGIIGVTNTSLPSALVPPSLPPGIIGVPNISIQSGMLSPSSFINMLPQLSEIKSGSEDRGSVPNISILNFMNQMPQRK